MKTSDGAPREGEHLPYRIYGKPLSRAEANAFVEDYKSKARRPNDRHMILLSHVESGQRVLDFGSGWGSFSYFMWEKGCDVLGIDQDPESVKIAKEITGERDRLRFEQARIQDIPANQFDVVVSNQVIEHVHNTGNHLMQINRVLKVGGTLIVATPNVINPQFVYYQMSPHPENEFRRISQTVQSNYTKTHDHIHGWDPYSFCRLVCTLGFQFIAHEYMEGVPFPGPRTWETRLPLVRNLCYTMMFKMRKTRYIEIGNWD